MSDLPEPVSRFIDTVNRHDEDGFLNAFTSDGYVDDWGRVFRGRESIKAWSDKEFIGANGVLTVQEQTVDGDQATVVGDWASSHANGLSSFTFILAGDKLSAMVIREG